MTGQDNSADDIVESSIGLLLTNKYDEYTNDNASAEIRIAGEKATQILKLHYSIGPKE
jgi:hypothetical protein